MTFWKGVVYNINDICAKWKILIHVEEEAMEH